MCDVVDVCRDCSALSINVEFYGHVVGDNLSNHNSKFCAPCLRDRVTSERLVCPACGILIEKVSLAGRVLNPREINDCSGSGEGAGTGRTLIDKGVSDPTPATEINFDALPPCSTNCSPFAPVGGKRPSPQSEEDILRELVEKNLHAIELSQNAFAHY